MKQPRAAGLAALMINVALQHEICGEVGEPVVQLAVLEGIGAGKEQTVDGA